jgi:hypothetical protein
MDRRWQQQRDAAKARWAQITSNVALEGADITGVQPRALSESPSTTEAPSAVRLLEDMRQLELKDAAESSGTALDPMTPHWTGWLRDTQRALMVIAALSCSLLLALLYFGGFLG